MIDELRAEGNGPYQLQQEWIDRADRILWTKVSISVYGCWEYEGRRNEKGYGTFNRGGRRVFAHRYVWALVNGPIPNGLQVLHHCDNPSCVRTAPDERYPEGHLFLGTAADNIHDMLAKGRQSPLPRSRGERNGNAKLRESDVRAIRVRIADGEINSSIAPRFGVSPSLIQFIRKGVAWRHLP